MANASGRASRCWKSIPSIRLIAALAAQVGQADTAALADIIWLVFDEARLLDGEKPTNAADFAARLTRVLTKAMAEPVAKTPA